VGGGKKKSGNGSANAGSHQRGRQDLGGVVFGTNKKKGGGSPPKRGNLDLYCAINSKSSSSAIGGSVYRVREEAARCLGGRGPEPERRLIRVADPSRQCERRHSRKERQKGRVGYRQRKKAPDRVRLCTVCAGEVKPSTKGKKSPRR